MMQLYDFCDNSKSVKQQQLSEVLQGRLEQQQKSLFQEWLSLPPNSIETPSLIFNATGTILTELDDDMTLGVEYVSQFGPIREVSAVLDRDKRLWSFEVSKKNAMMQAGINSYTLVLKK